MSWFFSLPFSLIFGILVPTLILSLVLLVCKNSLNSRNKPSPFECGFEEFTSPRINFSLKFYFIVIIFLVFDAEIALMLPLPLSFYPHLPQISSISLFILTAILILGLLAEWQQGGLSWSHYLLPTQSAQVC